MRIQFEARISGVRGGAYTVRNYNFRRRSKVCPKQHRRFQERLRRRGGEDSGLIGDDCSSAWVDQLYYPVRDQFGVDKDVSIESGVFLHIIKSSRNFDLMEAL